jgi:hypothetical protein
VGPPDFRTLITTYESSVCGKMMDIFEFCSKAFFHEGRRNKLIDVSGKSRLHSIHSSFTEMSESFTEMSEIKMSVNPYETPSDVSQQLPTTPRADGKFLIVRSEDVFPLYCVKTAFPISQQDLQRRRLTWCSPWVLLVALLSGPLLILVYLLVRKNCVLQVGLSSELQRSYRKWRIITILAVVLLFLALPVAAVTDSPVVIGAIVVSFFIALFSLFIGNSPIAVCKFHRGEFWISGCSPEFLKLVDR